MMRLLTADELFWIAGGDDGGSDGGGGSDSGGGDSGGGDNGDGGSGDNGDSSGGPSADCDDGGTNTSTASTSTNTTSTQASTTEESAEASNTSSWGWGGISFSASAVGDWDSDRPGAWNAPEPGPGTFDSPFSDMVNSENFFQDQQGAWNFDLGHALGFGFSPNNTNAFNSSMTWSEAAAYINARPDMNFQDFVSLEAGFRGPVGLENSARNGWSIAADYINAHGLPVNGNTYDAGVYYTTYNGIITSVDNKVTGGAYVAAAMAAFQDTQFAASQFASDIGFLGKIDVSYGAFGISINTSGIVNSLYGNTLTDLAGFINTAAASGISMGAPPASISINGVTPNASTPASGSRPGGI